MRLTDEERQIADDVAMQWALALEKTDDAWARALAFIAGRRNAIGDAEPAPATAAGVGAGDGTPRDTLRLTDAEREAVERAVGFCECTTSPLPTSQQIATLRGLLDRHKERET